MLLNMMHLYAASKFCDEDNTKQPQRNFVNTNGEIICGTNGHVYYRYTDEFLNDPDECFEVSIPKNVISFAATALRGSLNVEASITRGSKPDMYVFAVDGYDEKQEFKSIKADGSEMDWLLSPRFVDELDGYDAVNAIKLNMAYMGKIFDVSKLISNSDKMADPAYYQPILRFRGKSGVVTIDFNNSSVDCYLMPIKTEDKK